MNANTSTEEIYRCTPRQARSAIIDCIGAGLVPFVQSSPGLGKSSIMRSIADDFGLAMIDHRLSTSAPEDLSGLPEFYTDDDGIRRARFVPFDLFPIVDTPLPKGKDGWMLFLDEANSASKAVQAASYKLVLDKMVGQNKIHGRVAMTMAGNLATDRALVNVLSTAMQSRVIHIQMMVSLQEWLEDVAIPQDYDERIIAFINYKGETTLMDFRPDHQDMTFCCPRTWEFMNRLIKGKQFRMVPDPLNPNMMRYEMEAKAHLYAGTITSGVAVEFIQFTKVFHNIVKIEDVVRDPQNTPVPPDSPSRWAVISHLATKVDDTTFDKVATYANRFDLQFKVLFYRTLLVRRPELRQHPTFAKAMVELAQYLHGA
jgi:hypothetical protein